MWYDKIWTTIILAARSPFWGSSYWDVYNEGDFVNAVTNEPLGLNGFSPPWDVGEPNGNNIENCVTILANGDGAWNDDSCWKTFCSFCELDKLPNIKLRGKKDNTKLLPKVEMHGNYYFWYWSYLEVIELP